MSEEKGMSEENIMSEEKPISEEQQDESGESAEQTQPEDIERFGRIEWLDLTVGDAPRLRDFYAAVVGWKAADVDMGNYADYCMNLPTGDTIAGVCHARGDNARLPPQWLVYVRVRDVQESAETCLQRGGKVLDGPRRMGGNEFCVIQDPAGAVMALLSDRKGKNS